VRNLGIACVGVLEHALLRCCVRGTLRPRGRAGGGEGSGAMHRGIAPYRAVGGYLYTDVLWAAMLLFDAGVGPALRPGAVAACVGGLKPTLRHCDATRLAPWAG
jgi:hypothetical protein